MAASYPTSQKTFTTKSSGDVVQAAHVNDLQDEVVALEQGLLSGLSHTVKPVATNLYDLGSSTLRWRNLYLSGTVIGAGAVTLGSTLAVSGAITQGTSVSLTPSTSADDLVLQGAGNVGLSLLTDSVAGGGSDRTQTLAFGASGISAADAWMRYSTSTRALDWGTTATSRLVLDASGHLRFTAKLQRLYLYYTSATDYAAITTDAGSSIAMITGTTSPAIRLFLNPAGVLHPGTDNTQILGASTYRWNQLFLGEGSISAPAIALGSDSVGFYADTSLSRPRVNLQFGGNQTWSVRYYGASTGHIAILHGGGFGTGNVAGSYLQIANNGSGFGAAGCLSLLDKQGTAYFLWVDGSGNLRIHTAPPVESTGTADTDGTIVGTQS